MANDKGVEDSVAWTKMIDQTRTPCATICRSCGKTIILWHCADSGCVWCTQCGTNAKDIRDKRKNGEA